MFDDLKEEIVMDESKSEHKEEEIQDEPLESDRKSSKKSKKMVIEDEIEEESEEEEKRVKKSKKSKRKNEEINSEDDDFVPEKETSKSRRKYEEEEMEEEPQKVTARQAKMKENKSNPPSKKIKSSITLDNLISFDETPQNKVKTEVKNGEKEAKKGEKKEKKVVEFSDEINDEEEDESLGSEGEKEGKGEEIEEEEEEQVDLEDEEKETREEALKTVRNSCDFAMVAHFLDIFRPFLSLDSKPKQRILGLEDQGKYSIDKLEDSIVTCRSSKGSPRDSKHFLSSIHLKLMTSFMSAKKPPMTEENWDKSLKNLIKREMLAGNCHLDENPMEKMDSTPHVWGGRPTVNYWTLPAATKCKILRILCEWVLDYCEKVQNWIKGLDEIEIDGRIREKPGGTDGKGWSYWTLDVHDETPRFYREKLPKKGETMGEWETVSTTMDELNAFRNSLAESTNSADKTMVEFLDTEILPALVKQEQKREESIKKMKKLEQFGLSTRNIVYEGRLRRSVRKTPDYVGEDDEIDEE